MVDQHGLGEEAASDQIGAAAEHGTDRRRASGMAKGAHVTEAHREDDGLKIIGGAIPGVDAVGRAVAIAVAALVVAVNVAESGEGLGKGAIDAGEHTGGVEDDKRRTLATPIETMQTHAIDGEETAERFACGTR